jgi:hypothetical protein
LTFFSVTEGDDEENNSFNNPPESGSGVAVSVSGPESRKTPVRGQTTGAVSAAAAANDSFNEGSQILKFFLLNLFYTGSFEFMVESVLVLEVFKF